jgi:hypothetical protein
VKRSGKTLEPDDGEFVEMYTDGHLVEIAQAPVGGPLPKRPARTPILLCEREARELRDWLIEVLE